MLPLAQQLKKKFPLRGLVVSTTTATGQKLARERLPFADAVFYFPLDWRGPIQRALAVVRPAVVIVETEIWPNLRATRAELGQILSPRRSPQPGALLQERADWRGPIQRALQ